MEKEVVEVLEHASAIKEYCKKHLCNECPFYNIIDDCYFRRVPAFWRNIELPKGETNEKN